MGRQKIYLSGANILGFQVTVPLQLLSLAKELQFDILYFSWRLLPQLRLTVAFLINSLTTTTTSSVYQLCVISLPVFPVCACSLVCR